MASCERAPSTCATPPARARPSPTASRVPTIARTIEWQKASAPEVDADEALRPAHPRVQDGAHRGRTRPGAAERQEVVLADE
jgi:hypothetical protein